MKVKELLNLLSTEMENRGLAFVGYTGLWRIVTDIKLSILDVTLVRSGNPLLQPLELHKIIERLRSQGHKDLYYESYLDSVGKTKIESLEIISVIN